MSQIYNYNITVSEKAIDENGHVNNVEYLRWMQDAAKHHSQEVGCDRSTRTLDATWVARSNWIEYFQPAFVGEEIALLTWISNFRRVRSLRKYQFVRLADRQILAKAETNWIFIDLKNNRPRAIPENISNLFKMLGENEESKALDRFIDYLTRVSL